jgi:hypothetical protein
MIFTREKEWANLCTPYNIFIDGQKKGQLNNGETTEIEVFPGTHEIFVSIPWSWHRSAKIVISVLEGNIYYFKCKGNTKGWKGFHNFWYIFIDYNNYLVLELCQNNKK